MRPTHRVTAGVGGDGLEQGAGAKDVLTAGGREESSELLREHIGKRCRPALWKMEKLFRFPLFMCCVSDVEPICHPGQNCKDPYIHALIPTLSLSVSLSFSSFFRFFFWGGLESFVETFLKEVMLAQTLFFPFLSFLFCTPVLPFAAPKPNKAATFHVISELLFVFHPVLQ